ncbi:hypothetical protein BCR41DRAFT_375042 [Lobosporangium transversale]|uniref:Uncharacterized protein n=1 Tax=Lobosporangium transversale TaxID=64571 RepID=A0A1Y2G865_9FUNG|nr:hypothetical protein BCR41DRAFT_375042 [Lobosporangium transversale]ORZ04035.1 hypothetical protein BCR41DRAFT_375042 [Lobosporangium transversale]|eukprot:XP_021876312.1 hypothetical protein BCR41DRAFT_375042 [Lobosporangium transversale]
MFLHRLRGFNLGHGAATCSGVPRQNQIPFTPLTQSVATQLFLEIKRYFRHDSVELYKKAEAQRNKGVISGSSIVDINENHSTIENFARLNGVTKGGRTMLPHNPPRSAHSAMWLLEPMSTILPRSAHPVKTLSGKWRFVAYIAYIFLPRCNGGA